MLPRLSILKLPQLPQCHLATSNFSRILTQDCQFYASIFQAAIWASADTPVVFWAITCTECTRSVAKLSVSVAGFQIEADLIRDLAELMKA